MKKSSFLASILAICLATFSSYKDSQTNYLANRWETFGVTADAVFGGPGPSSPSQIYSAKITDGFYNQANSSIQALLMNLLDVDTYQNTFNQTKFPHRALCAPDITHICIATVSYYNSMPNSAYLVDYNFGDYSFY